MIIGGGGVVFLLPDQTDIAEECQVWKQFFRSGNEGRFKL
jgi:hypothetical protein